MLEIQSKYQAIFFANASHIAPTTEIIQQVLELFIDVGMLPTIANQVELTNGQITPRIRLVSLSQEWSIAFGLTRIDIEKIAITKNGENMGEISEFVKTAIEYFSRIITAFKLKGSRLSLATSGMFEEMNLDQLKQIQTKFNNNLPFYENFSPYEWRVHNVASIDGVKINSIAESINLITSISRSSGQILESTGMKFFDRIEVSFDINTNVANTDSRFSIESLNDFFNYAIATRDEILNQVEMKIHE